MVDMRSEEGKYRSLLVARRVVKRGFFGYGANVSKQVSKL